MTTEEMRVLELNSQYLGVTLSMLMQNAGREVARIIVDTESIEGKRVTILCGLGGNGGDGMVAARYLQEAGAIVSVYLVGSKDRIASSDAQTNWSILENLDTIPNEALKTESAIKSCRAIKDCDILIDALLGFGVHSTLREPIRTAVKAFNDSPAKKYSIDLPTGVDSDTGKIHGDAVKADVTITLHAEKTGLSKASEHAGEVHVVSIGIPLEASYICGPGDLSLFVGPRKATSHKGDFGRILVIGGSDVYSGAPTLTGLAALRTGADLVSVLAPEPVASTIRNYSPNLMVTSTETTIFSPESLKTALLLVESNDVIALGPGLGRATKTRDAVIQLLQEIDKTKCLVIDADGLKCLAGSGLNLDSDRAVLTPHWGELGVILEKDLGTTHDPEERLEYAKEAAELFNAMILLKGHQDIIASPDNRYRFNRTGVPAMTVGGTGDVLTGITAALLARKSAFQSACAAAFISGRAGEIASKKLGNHLMATDCIEHIHSAMES
ncbi:MAG: Bifunctional NAD(P)H-hydrate repair enzyme Nnr [Candidatus Thorarchaeota archaeon]|nr:MAG: Bifunctional NAD(P)H-hydrate repair enzyme Nnr [Candidatus Thorarchaeota archaeon]